MKLLLYILSSGYLTAAISVIAAIIINRCHRFLIVAVTSNLCHKSEI